MASNIQIVEHINQFAPMIQKEAKDRGYKVCSPIIAQSITESISNKDKSGWSFLKYKHHNMFGMKAGRYWAGAKVNAKTGEEYLPGTITFINDYFRSYPDYTSGIVGYFEFINTNRYANLKQAKTPEEYLTFIKKDGYATSSKYYYTNMDRIDKFDLRRYDSFQLQESRKELPVLRLGCTGAYVKAWQTYLKGLNLYYGEIDGLFSNELRDSVIKYQKNLSLVVDGVIGKRTWDTVPNIVS